ncbi:type II toxin-antitoxin system HicA family toxin [Candidatus Poriferisodalis sp.]|uniref:type II toxin-antitoxin system HicA family toxin n=1 Tax=Candidatus Poriferisodalis sp. TaxID=3101277 RepID=UPI003B02B5A3
MPRRTELVRRIRRLADAHGCTAVILRQGKHEIWECAGFRFPIPRHRVIADGTARTILGKLEAHLERVAQGENS